MSQIWSVGLYQPGHTVLHRLPVGVKVVSLAVLSLLIVTVRSMWWSVACLVVTVLLALLGRVSIAVVLRALRPVLIIAVVIAAFGWWQSGYAKAIETLLDLLALALAAVVLSATTPVNALLDAVVRWLRPWQRWGANPDRVALTFTLALQALPGTVALAVETRDAARARGLRTPRAFLSPFVIRVVARAQDTGQALMARGLGD